MAEAARYMFDRAFDIPARGSEPEEAAAARKMAEACCTAYEEGQADGEANALKRIEAETLEQVKVLIGSAQKLLGAVEGECSQIRRDAMELANMTASLLAGELIARHPTLNPESLFREALEHIGDAPHIAVTVNDAHAAMVQSAVSAIAAERGFTGKIVVLGDPETKFGDCSLQWADGGIALDFEKTLKDIRAIVRRHLDRLTAEEPAVSSIAADAGTPDAHTDTAPDNNTGTETASAPPAGSGESQ